MKFSTKAKTLVALQGVVRTAAIPGLTIVNYSDWSANPESVLKNLESTFGANDKLIVRSSCSSEDAVDGSAAGKFLSVPEVRGADGLQTAIAKVFASYDRLSDGEHVFVQAMVADVVCSGVIFTKDPATGAPYYTINYDESGRTDTVTAGIGHNLKSLIIYKNAAVELTQPFATIKKMIVELESIFADEPLDIEFAVDRKGQVHLLQVRRLAMVAKCLVAEPEIDKCLAQIEKKVSKWLEPKPFLLGSRTIFGVMPDWNPAEIIGVRPRPLALSLYKELVTDSTWAYQRDNYGYRNLRSQPLIQSFQGCPYIDVRVDFNSFVPADIPEPLADKLVEYYLDRLNGNPELHDKVEFDIIFSCYHFDLKNQIQVLRASGFTEEEVESLTQSLRGITTRIIDKHTGLWKKDLERISRLEERHRQLMSSSMDTVEKIYWLLEDCKRYGTLPFAGLARAGFIAVQILKSMVSTGLMSQPEYAEFMNSLNTVSTRMTNDFNSLSREPFLAIYGHLRPGTYDILSARYDEAPDTYFEWVKREHETVSTAFKLSLPQYKKLESELAKHGIELDVLSLFDFLKSAIEGREYAKFLFTRNVSDALSLAKQLGADLGFTPEDLSFLDIQAVQKLYSSSQDAATVLKASIELGRQSYQLTRSLILPSLIFKPEDIYSFHLLASEPNYVTHLSVESDVVILNSNESALEGKIVFIENADPGYDWIFTKGIRAFITMYGGANSHMAIRAGEMKIPAIVGAGEANFTRWSKAKRLSIDCCNRQVKVLQ